MEDSEAYRKAQQILEEFEALKSEKPTDAWQQSLNERLATTQSSFFSTFDYRHFYLLISFFAILNGTFIFTVLTKNTPFSKEKSKATPQHIANLKTISKELLATNQPIP